jgi:type VI secretion system secreted protein Hcp
MAFDAFLKIDGIEGESTDDKHKGEIEVLSFSWGVSQQTSGSASSAGSLTSQRADFHDFAVVKAIDKASPLLMLQCADGTHIKSVRLELCRAGGDKQPYMEYKFTDVVITAVRPGGSAHGNESLPWRRSASASARRSGSTRRRRSRAARGAATSSAAGTSRPTRRSDRASVRSARSISSEHRSS